MSAVDDWWTSFFDGPFVELQRAGLRDESAQEEVDELTTMLALQPGASVLDVPCGTGRHSLELARRGFKVTGVDFNARVVDVAAQRAAREGLQIVLRTQDMRRIADAHEHDAVICHWGSFGYFDDDDNAAFVARCAAALRPAGKFFLDTHVMETFLPRFRERDWSFIGDGERRYRVLEECSFDFDTGRLESTWTFQRGAAEQSRFASIRIYTYRELRCMLQEAGFSTFRPYEPGGAPLRMGSRRLRLVAVRS